MSRPIALLLLIQTLVSPALAAQSLLQNGGFETADSAGRPAAWKVGGGAPYTFSRSTQKIEGRLSAHIARSDTGGTVRLGSLSQTIRLPSLRGTLVRLRAYARSEIDRPSWAGLFVRVMQPDGYGFFDNMQSDPIRSSSWEPYQIVVPVSQEADSIRIGFFLSGVGQLWIDSISFQSLDSADLASLSPPSAVATGYLDSAIAIMRIHSLRRDSVDWPALRATAMRYAGEARRPGETHFALERAIKLLGDHHSFLIRLPVGAGTEAADTSTISTDARLLPGRVGYLVVPPFGDTDSVRMRTYFRMLEDSLLSLKQQGACTWVLDLRGNWGGNMWPMLAGLRGFFSPGVVGKFMYPDTIQAWKFNAYGPSSEEEDEARISEFGERRLDLSKSPVALLIGEGTASSAEAVTLSFRGRPRTKSFGQPTMGLSTGNEDFTLPDGAELLLTVALMADRSGRGDGSRITPDVLLPADPAPSATDTALAAAVAWLSREPDCQ